jgi:DNA polymerase III epsilon subunit-like protein
MKFPKDILIIDFEGWEEPTQLGAILLDKETLKEKDSFVSYIYADLQGKPSIKSGITQEMLTDAPSQAVVAKRLYEQFGTNIFLSSFVLNLDLRHIRTIMKSANIDFLEYDYHVLDIWSLAYIHLLKQGYEGDPHSEPIFQAFKSKPRGNHDALEDCRIAADILRTLAQHP